MTVDLDSARVARREALGESPVVVFHGQSYELPPEMPFALPEALGEVAQATKDDDAAGVSAGVVKGLRALFGEAYQGFMDAGPTMADVMALLDGVVTEYGFKDVGEPQASEGS